MQNGVQCADYIQRVKAKLLNASNRTKLLTIHETCYNCMDVVGSFDYKQLPVLEIMACENLSDTSLLALCNYVASNQTSFANQTALTASQPILTADNRMPPIFDFLPTRFSSAVCHNAMRFFFLMLVCVFLVVFLFVGHSMQESSTWKTIFENTVASFSILLTSILPEVSSVENKNGLRVICIFVSMLTGIIYALMQASIGWSMLIGGITASIQWAMEIQSPSIELTSSSSINQTSSSSSSPSAIPLLPVFLSTSPTSLPSSHSSGSSLSSTSFSPPAAQLLETRQPRSDDIAQRPTFDSLLTPKSEAYAFELQSQQ